MRSAYSPDFETQPGAGLLSLSPWIYGKGRGNGGGVTKPQATFSTCFGAPFMPLHPSEYARLLGKKIEEHRVKCWLVNTGWTGGPYGVGHRISIRYTRALLNAALEGKLDHAGFVTEPVFGLEIPRECPGIPTGILMPRESWKNKETYDQKAGELAKSFQDQFKQYETLVADEIKNAGPVG